MLVVCAACAAAPVSATGATRFVVVSGPAAGLTLSVRPGTPDVRTRAAVGRIELPTAGCPFFSFAGTAKVFPTRRVRCKAARVAPWPAKVPRLRRLAEAFDSELAAARDLQARRGRLAITALRTSLRRLRGMRSFGGLAASHVSLALRRAREGRLEAALETAVRALRATSRAVSAAHGVFPALPRGYEYRVVPAGDTLGRVAADVNAAGTLVGSALSGDRTRLLAFGFRSGSTLTLDWPGDATVSTVTDGGFLAGNWCDASQVCTAGGSTFAAAFQAFPGLTGPAGLSNTVTDCVSRSLCVGLSDDALGGQAAVVWRDGRVARLRLPGGASTALGVNPAGQVVGAYVAPAGSTHAFRYSLVSGRTTDLNGSAASSVANAIDRLGIVGGARTPPDASQLRAALWWGGERRDLGPADERSTVVALNDDGLAVGSVGSGSRTRAALFALGRTIDLNAGAPAGLRLTQAVAVNARGQIAATGTLAGMPVAVLLQPHIAL